MTTAWTALATIPFNPYTRFRTYFGIDYPKHLILAYKNNIMPKDFPKHILEAPDSFYKYMLTNTDENIPPPSSHGIKRYYKHEEYFLEDIIIDYMSRKEVVTYPFMILQNGKWFTCSPETNYMLVPFIGE